MDMTPFNISALISVPFFVAAAVLFVKDVRSHQAAEARKNGNGAVAKPVLDYFVLVFALFGIGLTIAFFGLGLSVVGAMN